MTAKTPTLTDWDRRILNALPVITIERDPDRRVEGLDAWEVARAIREYDVRGVKQVLDATVPVLARHLRTGRTWPPQRGVLAASGCIHPGGCVMTDLGQSGSGVDPTPPLTVAEIPINAGPIEDQLVSNIRAAFRDATRMHGDLEAISDVLGRGVADERKLATIRRLVDHALGLKP